MDVARALLRRADAVLRGTLGDGSLRHHAPLLIVFGMFYGAVMGSFGGVTGDRFWQVVVSATKVPFLLLATFALSLPSFFVLNTVSGLRADFEEVLAAVLSTQASVTVILASLAPLTAFFYVSGCSHDAAVLFNALMFGVASLAGQWSLRRSYRRLIARDPLHRRMLRAWIFVYALVGVQMAWVLRPFVGGLGAPVQFLRADSWSNAYEAFGALVYQTIFGRR